MKSSAKKIELVAGHRRHRASELAEKETMPVIVRDLDDDAATIIMVDSNLQRESLLPSERAFVYKMKLEAIKHQGERSDLTSRQVGEKSQTSIQLVANQVGESQRQVQRFIRLTELIPELLDMVDEKKIALNPAYELSFLKKIAVITAVIIVLAMNLVGSLLISALVIFPALSSMRVYKTFFSVTVCSVVLSVICAVVGILLSILAGTPVGSTIVAIDIVAFIISYTIGKIVGGK